MSLTKLLKAPIKLFRKDVISFVIIRRHDLEVSATNENLRYIAVKPGSSMGVLRQKIWHLLDLPDYCEEIIVLKSNNGTEITLMELKKGNDPQHPFFLEVWSPCNQISRSYDLRSTLQKNMLSIAEKDKSSLSSNLCICEENSQTSEKHLIDKPSICIKDTMKEKTTKTLTKFSLDSNVSNNLDWDDRKSDLCKISSSSIFQKLPRRKSDNFINILLKIQSDLNTLSTKLSNLENRISA